MKDLSIPELHESARSLDRELYVLRNELSLNRKLEKSHLLKAKRKERARVLTRLTQMQRSQEAKNGATNG